MRRIEVHLPLGDGYDAVMRAIEQAEPIDCVILPTSEEARWLVQLLVRDSVSQQLVDAIQSALRDTRGWRLNVVAMEATLPALNGDDEEMDHNTRAIREEILGTVTAGAALNRDFLMLVAFSTVVAAVGMNASNVAAVIGAMVIAPLLGPVLAFAMGAALGDRGLILTSARTLAAGILLALVSAFAISLVIPLDRTSAELMSRAEVRLDSVALALAAGGAAALALAKGRGQGLVGVMVAAALLPPGAAIGLFAGAGALDLAARAGLLLVLNVACLVLAALAMFRAQKIRPRGWLEQQNATRSVRINLVAWAVLLVLAGLLIIVFDLGSRVDFQPGLVP